MRDRIEPRPSRVGTADNADPERILELEERRDKHERLTRAKAKRPFRELLDEKMTRGDRDGGKDNARGDRREDEEGEGRDAEAALLGLDPNQSAAIVNRGSGRRSARVIIRG